MTPAKINTDKHLMSVEVVHHSITDEYAWPQGVSDLFHRFSRPLPKLLASDEFQTDLPLHARELLLTALESPALVLEDEERDARTVTDVIDTILSSVRVVRAASAFGIERGHEQARLSWTALITMLGIAISENVYFAYDADVLCLHFFSNA